MTEQSAFDKYISARDAEIAAFEAVLSDPSQITEEAMEQLLAAQTAKRDAEVSMIASDEVVVTGATKAELIALICGADISGVASL